MASPNSLRIINYNWVDLPSCVITPSSSQSSSTVVANLKRDTKSLVWRSSPTTVSSTQVKAILIVDLGTTTTVGGVVLAFTNLNSSNATIRVTGYTAAPTFTSGADLINSPSITGTPITGYNSGNVLCCPWNNLDLPNWGTNPSVNSNYSYGGGTYARVWLPTLKSTSVRYLAIEITDYYSTSTTGRYIEVSRLIVGNYWSPKFNTGYGMSSGIKDMSTHERTESGDMLTQLGPRYKTLEFNLDWLHHTDRKEMTKLLLGNGISKPITVSLFPDSTGEDQDFHREYVHQIYGKLTDTPNIALSNLEFYSTSLQIEEV